ncbi:MAG: ASKHA domain-containing protein [Clostridia bacterium]
MKHTVKIHKNNIIVKKEVSDDINIMSFLHDNSVNLQTPCGGKMTCGKCIVKIIGISNTISSEERQLLGEDLISGGYRLACFNNIESDIDIYLDDDYTASILTDGKTINPQVIPIVEKKYIKKQNINAGDQTSFENKIKKLTGAKEIINPLSFLRKSLRTIEDGNLNATFIVINEKLSSVELKDTSNVLYGIAFDVGTTTLVAYLYNLKTGERIDIHSAMNPQQKFGADVISRIEYSSKSDDNLNQVHELIIKAINKIIISLCEKNNLNKNDIYETVFVGNTTMIHFLMRLNPKNIGVSPFVTVTNEMYNLNPNEIGINMNLGGIVVIYPCVSSYIGADTVAAVLSTEINEKKEFSLLIDIGTNGEIVIGNNKKLYSCAAAAGPAFEGANIRNGIGGIVGAIDSIYMSNSGLAYRTIGGKQAIGICGSGVVDAISIMLSEGIIDETGRIAGSEDDLSKINEGLRERLIKVDGQNAFRIVTSDKKIDIVITQKDVRELQNAKAAIAAGIKILAKSADIPLKMISNIYLAGGFGNFINIDSAIKIGLLPDELRGKIISVGNAAGVGAIEGLLSKKILNKANNLAKNIEYIELSAYSDFMNLYVENMMFEN